MILNHLPMFGYGIIRNRKEKDAMCAAKVEVLSDNVIAAIDSISKQPIGEGKKTYYLRDFNFDWDEEGNKEYYLRDFDFRPQEQFHNQDVGTHSLTLELGENIGRAQISTRINDTSIRVTAARISAGLESPTNATMSVFLFDESYEMGEHNPQSRIVDGNENLLAIVTHLSSISVSNEGK